MSPPSHSNTSCADYASGDKQTPEHTTRVNSPLNTQILTGILYQHSFGVVMCEETVSLGVQNRNIGRAFRNLFKDVLSSSMLPHMDYDLLPI
jgi:hypothetical protein